MYYLNDKHPKYEFTVYIRCGNGTPYLIPRKFETYSEVCKFLNEKAKWHFRYNQRFYIDDSFFSNEYKKDINGIYYKILKRPVSDWKELKKGA